MDNKSVLLVEDDPSSADILSQLLQHNQMSVDAIDSGEGAIRLLEDKFYDLIIVDLALPGMDGWELLRHIQTRYETSPITVALTAYYTPLLAKEAKEAGFAAAFPKPITNSLLASLRALL